MSVFYEIHENLSAKNTESLRAYSIVSKMQFQLAMLGMLMLVEDVNYCELQLDADGVKYDFSGTTPTGDYKALLKALEQANCVQLRAEYGYTWHGGYADLPIGPFPVVEYAESIMQDEEIGSEEKDFFYVMHNKADCSQGMGIMCAYGVKDGKTYCGTIEPQRVEQDALDGAWFTSETVLCAELPETEEIHAIVPALQSVGAETQLHVGDQGEMELYVNSVSLKDGQHLEKLLVLFDQVEALPDAKVGYIGNDSDDSFIDFVDNGGAYPRMLKVHKDSDGKVFYQIIAV